MLISRTRLDCPGKDVRLFCLGALPRRPRTRILTGASRWTFGSIADAVKNAYASQRNGLDQGSKNLAPKELEDQDIYPPATFQQLTPDVLVLLDPQNDRLLYLVGVEEDARADHVIQQVRPLLRASAAPYLHLMALPAHLRRALLREFPGGWPIITQVPLPAELQPPGEDGDEPSVGGEGRGREPPAGVLGFLYGSRSPSEAVSGEADDEAAGLQRDDLVSPSDVPDDVLSRRKKMRSFRRWLKGASAGVAQCRNNRTPYKFQQLIQGMNTFGSMTAFLASSRILMVRNNIADNMATDTDAVSREDYLEVAAAAAQEYYEDQQGDDEEEDEGAEEGADDSIELSDLSPEDMKALEEILTAFSLPKGSAFVVKAKRREGVDDDDDDGEVDADEAEGDGEDEDEDDEAEAEAATAEVAGDEEEEEEDGSPPEVRAIPAPELRRRRDWDDDTPFNVDMPLSHGPMGWRAALRVRAEPPESSRDLVAESLRADAEYLVNMQRLEALWHDQTLGQGRRQGPGQAQEQGPGQGQGQRSRSPSGGPSDAAPGAEALGGQPPGALGSGLGLAGRMGSGRAGAEQPQPQPRGADGGEGENGAVDAHGNHHQQQQHPHPHQQHPSGGAGGLEADWRQAESRAAAAATTTGRLRYGRVGDGGGSGGGSGEALWGIPTDRLIRPIRRHVANGGAAEDSAGSSGDATPTAAAAAGTAAEAVPAAEPDPAAAAGAAGRPATGDIPVQTARTQPPSAMPQRPSSPLGGGAAAAGPTGFIASTRMRRSAGVPGPARGAGGNSANGANSAGTTSSSTATAAAGDVDALQPQPQHDVLRPNDAGGDGSDDGEEQGAGSGSDLAPEGRLSGRARMVRRPRRPSLRSPGGHPPGSAAAAASAGAGGAGAGTSGASARAPDAGDGVPSTAGGGAPSGGGVVPVPAYKHLRPPGPGGSAPGGATAPPGAPHAGVSKLPRGWASSHPPPGAAAASSPQPPPPPPPPLSPSEAVAGGGAAMDFEQLAHYILGRNATAEEVQDLARAVFQSTDVEEAFAAAAAAPQPQPLPQPVPPQPQPQQQEEDERPLPLEGSGGGFSGPGFLRTRWRRPGSGRPSVLESLVRRNTRRLHVVTPRRCRLRVPPQVAELARRMQPAAVQSGGRIAAGGGAGRDGPSPSGGEARRGGRGRVVEKGDGAEGAAAPSGSGGGAADATADALGFLGRFVEEYMATTGRLRPEATRVRVRGQLLVEYSMVDRSNKLSAQHPPSALSSSGPSQEKLAGEVVRALEAAAPLGRKRAEALTAFLRGRRPQPDAAGAGEEEEDGDQGWRQGWGGRGGLPGLVRGRDAVVLLPRALLEPAAGVWQRAEERLMHPDVQRGRRSARF